MLEIVGQSSKRLDHHTMSWGDPFSKFYKSDDVSERLAAAIEKQFIPGTLIKCSDPIVNQSIKFAKFIHVWSEPDVTSISYSVPPALAVILAIDCESDPTDDWLFVLLCGHSTRAFGWLPTKFIEVVK